MFHIYASIVREIGRNGNAPRNRFPRGVFISLSQPISRILLARVSGPDDHLSGITITRDLKRATKWFTLAPDRCFPQRPSPGSPAWALTPRFQPYLSPKGPSAVCFLLHFPWPRTKLRSELECSLIALRLVPVAVSDYRFPPRADGVRTFLCLAAAIICLTQGAWGVYRDSEDLSSSQASRILTFV